MPIKSTKNKHGNLPTINNELNDTPTLDNHIDQAIDASEQEITNGVIPVDASTVFTELDQKYFG